MVLFVSRPESLQDLDGLVDGGLVDHDFLQAPGERSVLFDVFKVLERGGSDHPELPRRQQRLDQHRQIHGPARGRPGANRGVNLVDEQNGHEALSQRRRDGFEPLLEVTSKASSRQERGCIEGEDLGFPERVGNLVPKQAKRQAFGQRRLAHAGVADEHGVVLAAAAENLERALQLGCPSDEWIKSPGAGALGQVHGVRAQGVACRRGAFHADPGLRDVRQLVRFPLGRDRNL